jgi:hypothetical protein
MYFKFNVFCFKFLTTEKIKTFYVKQEHLPKIYDFVLNYVIMFTVVKVKLLYTKSKYLLTKNEARSSACKFKFLELL